MHRCIPLSINLLLYGFHVGREDQVQNDSYDEDDSDAVLREDSLDDIREDREEVLALGEAESDTEGQGRDDGVPLREAALTDHLKTADDDGTKHHDGTAAEYGIRKSGEERTEHREDTGEDHDHGAGRDGETVDDLRHRDESHVLAERGDRQTAEE